MKALVPKAAVFIGGIRESDWIMKALYSSMDESINRVIIEWNIGR